MGLRAARGAALKITRGRKSAIMSTDEQFRNFRRSPVIGDIVHYNIRIFNVQHIQVQNARPDEQRCGMSSPVRKVHIWTVELLFAIHRRVTSFPGFSPTRPYGAKSFFFNIAHLGRSEWLWRTKFDPVLLIKRGRLLKSLSSIVLRKKSWTWIVIRLTCVKVPGEVV